jgi:hypothetical protein
VTWTLPRDGAGGQLARAYPVAFRLAKRLVKTVGMVTQVNCQSGTSYLIPSFYGNFRIAKNGTFGKTFTDTGIPSRGVHPNLSLELHGKLARGQLSGTWRMKAVFVDSSGKQTDSCDSGTLNWSASA